MLRKYLLSFTATLLWASSSLAYFDIDPVKVNKHNFFGLGLGSTFIEANGQWKSLTQNMYPEFSAHYTHRFKDKPFGIEVGYLWSTAEPAVSLMTPGQELFAGSLTEVKIPDGPALELSSKIRLRSAYLDLVSLISDREIQPYFSIGTALTYHTLEFATNINGSEDTTIADRINKIKFNSKLVLRLGAGILLHSNDKTMVRLGVNWVGNSRVEATGQKGFILGEKHKKPFKDNLNFKIDFIMKL